MAADACSERVSPIRKMKRLSTGGPLNHLCETMGVNRRDRSVPTSTLVSHHRPVDAEDMRSLIEQHYYGTCDKCTAVSKGPVEQFSLNLFNAQFKNKTFQEQHRRYSYEECHSFIYTLFCVAPLRGRKMELQSRRSLLRSAQEVVGTESGLHAKDATEEEDASFAVDWLLCASDGPVCGVQVKPSSVLGRRDVIAANEKKQSLYHLPVFMHVYDLDGEFDAESTRRIVEFSAASLKGWKTSGDTGTRS